jgi:hypothetical protein
VARKVRQRCGFGCIVCGCGYYHYEHIDPEFHEAKEHDPAKITLLCGRCHDLVTRGTWSKEKVAKRDKDPCCLRAGFARWDADLGDANQHVFFGDVEFYNPAVVLHMFGEDLLAIKPPEEAGAPVRVSARFYDEDEAATLAIVDNEVQVFVGNWDIETVARKTTIRRGPGEFALELEIEPRRFIVINRLDMCYKKIRIAITKGAIEVGRDGDSPFQFTLRGAVNSAAQCISIVDENDTPTDDDVALCIEGSGECRSNLFFSPMPTTQLRMIRDGLCISIGTKAIFGMIDVSGDR